ncbi:glycosyltransferase family 2 protein [Tenacibaculum sp. 190524A05c]|uniref:glycosyltransferase family 2 protein n=1 Tax=Tenacibaculum platacis TaxID=3137852 RepID=UPI0032B12EDE
MQPKVSIIIPSYNNLDQLKNCLQSIQNQNFENFEVWIIDGASTDGTQEYLKTLGPRFNYISEKDSGIYDAMNTGIKKSVGEWLYFLGSDDRFSNDSVLEEVFSTKCDEEIQILVGNIEYSKGLRFQSEFSSKLWCKNTVHHQSVFYKKELFQQLKYNLNYNVLADYDVNLKLFRKKVSFRKVETTIAICGEDGVSKKYNWNLYKEEINLKVSQAGILSFPFFFLLGVTKYCFRRIF